MTCQVLEELDLGMCKELATIRVHDFGDKGAASILSCMDHVPLGRYYVRRKTRGNLAAETRWPTIQGVEV